MRSGGELRPDRRRSLAQETGSPAMLDNHAKRAPRDATQISLANEADIRYWADKFGVSGDRLAEAVAAVGGSVEAVSTYLDEDALSYG
jgi:hypothetical protein